MHGMMTTAGFLGHWVSINHETQKTIQKAHHELISMQCPDPASSHVAICGMTTTMGFLGRWVSVSHGTQKPIQKAHCELIFMQLFSAPPEDYLATAGRLPCNVKIILFVFLVTGTDWHRFASTWSVLRPACLESTSHFLSFLAFYADEHIACNLPAAGL